MKPKIRTMTSQDKPAIIQILKAIPEFEPAEVVVAEEVVDSYLCDPSGSGYHVLVAEVVSSVVGYICYGPAPLTVGTWDIYWIAVAPVEQGKGTGKALMASAEDNIRKARGRLVLIETSSKLEYEKTRRFHHSQGYEVVAQITDFYAPGDDLVVFGKFLK